MNQFLCLADRERRSTNFLRGCEDRFRRVEHEQHFRVSCSEFPFLNRLLNRFRQAQESHEVRDLRAIFSRLLRHLLLGEVELARETVKGTRLFHRIQTLTLQVLDDGHLHRLLV